MDLKKIYESKNGVIYCGDCFDIMPKLDKVDIIITDPPYVYLKHKIETNIDIPRFIELSYNILKDNAFFVFFGLQPNLSFWVVEALKKFKYKSEVIWYKRKPSSPVLEILRLHENIMIFVKGKKQINDIRIKFTDLWYSLSDFIEEKTIEAFENKIKGILKDIEKIKTIIDYEKKGNNFFDIEAKKLNYITAEKNVKTRKSFITDWQTLTKGYKPRSLISFLPEHKRRGTVNHPTSKPINLMKYLIALTTKEGEVILDPFGGSGSTAVAAIEMKRKFILIEKDTEYCDLALKRIKEVEKDLKLF